MEMNTGPEMLPIMATRLVLGKINIPTHPVKILVPMTTFNPAQF
jgi:hypothetical protein